MKLSELLTAQGLKDVATQAEVNAMIQFTDEIWQGFAAKLPLILDQFAISGEQRDHMTTGVREMTQAAFQCGAIIAARQAILVLLKSIKNSEDDRGLKP